MTKIECAAFWCGFCDAGECTRDVVRLTELNLKSKKKLLPACVSMQALGYELSDIDAEAVLRKIAKEEGDEKSE